MKKLFLLKIYEHKQSLIIEINCTRVYRFQLNTPFLSINKALYDNIKFITIYKQFKDR